jgi:ribosomal protein S18 acetylase RimI-like enzyme
LSAPRRACEDDVDALLALWAVGRTAYAVTTDTPEAVRLVLERSPVFVVDGAEGLDGAVIAGWDGWRGNLYRLAVRPSARRRGLATALVRAAEAWLIEQGARRISLFVAFDNDEARAFWGTVGYAADEIIGRMVRDLPSGT